MSRGQTLKGGEDKPSWGGIAFGGHNLHYQLAKDKTLKLACEHLFRIMEVWIQILFIYSQIAQVPVAIDFCLHVEGVSGCSVLATGGSLLGCIIAEWSIYSHQSMSKEDFVFIVTLYGLCMFWTVGKNGS